jgi:hypothetical protein
MWNQEIGTGLDSFDTRPDTFLIIDAGEIFNNLRRECELAGEVSVVDFEDEMELDFFIGGLCSNLGYRRLVYAKAGIETLLINSENYLLRKFTEYQKHLWRTAGLELWGYFNHLGLYDKEDHHMYEYESMKGNAVILKKYNE